MCFWNMLCFQRICHRWIFGSWNDLSLKITDNLFIIIIIYLFIIHIYLIVYDFLLACRSMYVSVSYCLSKISEPINDIDVRPKADGYGQLNLLHGTKNMKREIQET